MSDQNVGKKMVEEMELEPFLSEYSRITGKVLEPIEAGERPDFILSDAEGRRVGVELVKAMLDPESSMWRRILDKLDFVDA
jgi:hypothetical protein